MTTDLKLSDLDDFLKDDSGNTYIRGRQVILIETKNLTNNTDPEKWTDTDIYTKLYNYVKNDEDYKNIRQLLIKNIKHDADIAHKTIYTTRIMDKGNKSSFDAFYNRYASAGITSEFDLNPSTASNPSFKIVDDFLRNELKSAWKDYKIPSTFTPSPRPDLSENEYGLINKFGSDSKKFIFKIDDIFYQYDDGAISEMPLPSPINCGSFGFVDVSANDCANVFAFLATGDENDLQKFIGFVNDQTNFDITNVHPYLALMVLHSFGFKAVRSGSRDGSSSEKLKTIINFNEWNYKLNKDSPIVLNKKSDGTDGTDLPDGHDIYKFILYMKDLINFINSNIYILNPELLNKEDINKYYDPITKRNRFNQVVTDKTDKIPVEGLTQFFEYKKFNKYLTTSRDLIRELFYSYGYEPPQYLQSGGSRLNELKGGSRLNELKDNFASGKLGHAQLEHIYTTLKNSLTNVTLDNTVDSKITEELNKLKTAQENLVKYAEFFDRVQSVYDLLKLTGETNIKFSSDDIDEIKKQFEEKIETHRNTEKLIAKFIDAIYKKDLDPTGYSKFFE